MDSIDLKPAGEPLIILTRIFDAPRKLVWKVWTDPAHMAQWWGPKGFTNPVCKMDVRPGGLWYATMRSPDGTFDCPNVFMFEEVVPPERLVFRDVTDYSKGWEKHTDIPLKATHTVTFIEQNGKTTMRMETRLATIDERDAMVRMGFIEGTSESLERFADVVRKLASEKSTSENEIGRES
jgi:uncharacterized protein YndB with AHSA1/START domain